MPGEAAALKVMESNVAKKSKDASIPDPLEPGHIQGQNPATPERVPGHTQVHDDDAKKKSAAGEAEKELDDALEHTFPASDPISVESTLVSGGRR